MTKFQPNPNIHLKNVGYEYQIINGNKVVTFTGVEVCSFLHRYKDVSQIMELHKGVNGNDSRSWLLSIR